MTWTARVNEKGSYKSSGQGFRTQGARLAVLAAQLIVAEQPQAPARPGGGRPQPHAARPWRRQRISSITWPGGRASPRDTHLYSGGAHRGRLRMPASRPRITSRVASTAVRHPACPGGCASPGGR